VAEPIDQAKQALANAAAGQAQTDAWHGRMRTIDERLPPRPVPKDDPRRGCVSPLGGQGWFKGFRP
jgi:hypothetical protein